MDATINPPVPGTTPMVLPQSRPTTSSISIPTTQPEDEAPVAAPVVPRKVSVRKTRTFFHLSRAGETAQAWGGILFFLVLGAGLWRADAHFTLWFFQGWMPGIILKLGLAQWLIPILFTIGQMYFFVGPKKIRVLREVRELAASYPDHEPSYRKYAKLRKQMVRHTVAFLLVSAVNIGTSAQGMYEWAAGRTINLFGGITLPPPGRTLQGICFVLGLLLAFGAEKAFKAAWDEYRDN